MDQYNIVNGQYYSCFGLTYEIKDDVMLLFCKLVYENKCFKYEYLRQDNKFINIHNENDIFEILFSDNNKIILFQENMVLMELKKLTYMHKILLWLGYEI